MDGLELRAVRGEDEPYLGAFAQAFAPGDVVRSAIERWGHFATPHPSGLRVVVAKAVADARGPERLAAIVMARPVPARIDEDGRVFAEVIAAAVHPLDRIGVRGPRVLAALGAAYLAEHSAPERDVITFGFGGESAWRSLRFGPGVELIRRQPLLVFDVNQGTAALPSGVFSLHAFGDNAAALFERCAIDWRACAVRDATTLAWRFPADGGYVRLVVGDAEGTLDAALVTARGAPGTLRVLDWLVPSDAVGAQSLLVQALITTARTSGLARIELALPPWSPAFNTLQNHGFKVHASDRIVFARSAHPRLDTWWLRDHWWFQPFDQARPRSPTEPPEGPLGSCPVTADPCP